MNSLFNSALKQSTAIRRDLSALSSSPSSSSTTTTSQPPPAALTGQLSASLTSLARTVDDYAALAAQEPNAAKADKARERVRSFRAELQDYREQFASARRARDEAAAAAGRAELLGRHRGHQTATPENPYANNNSSSGVAAAHANAHSPWAPRAGAVPRTAAAGGALSMGGGDSDYARETHALREQSFFANTHSALDEYLARGQAVLGDLGQQREVLKGTQRRLYSVANTLGVSGETIRMVERRAREDRWIFAAGALVFFAFCWLVLWLFR